MRRTHLRNRDTATTMIRIQLSEAQAQRLEQAFRSATDVKLRDRLNAVNVI